MFPAIIAGIASLAGSAISAASKSSTDNMNKKISNRQLDLAEKEYYSNLDIMNKNFGLQQEAFNYNKAQAELTRQREDNAFQRRVQDYVQAGFSPLAAQGVASSSQAPTLTAPQYDPSGVNQATTNRLTAYQNAIANNNQTAQLKLQSQQLKLAQLETVKEMAQSVFSIKGQILSNDRLQSETDWYNEHGYRDTTYQTLLSDFINGFADSYGGNARDFGKWSADRLQAGWNNMLKDSLGLSSNKSYKPNIQLLNSKKEQVNVSTFKYNVSAIEKMFQSKNIEKINVNTLRRYAKEIGWTGVENTLPDNAKKLSANTYQQLRESFNKYLEEIDKHNPKLKNTVLDNYIRLWSK